MSTTIPSSPRSTSRTPAPTPCPDDAVAGDCPRSPGRPRDERASRAITDAALRQLDALGYGRITMEGVATEAGVSRATIYRRYRHKADLVTAAIADAAVERDGHADAADARRALVRFLEEFDGRFAESCLEVIGGLIGDREEPHALKMHRERVVAPRSAYALSLLREAQAGGELDADADMALALQMLAGSVFFRRVSGDQADPRWAQRAVDAIWAGMAPRPR